MQRNRPPLVPDPPNTLAHFLSFELYAPKDHPRGHHKRVYDDEFIHYDLMTILLKGSARFATSILHTPSDPNIQSVTFTTNAHPFDMKVDTDHGAFFFEVKTWSPLRIDQFQRQSRFLAQNQGSGIYLLSGRQAKQWSADRIANESRGRSRLLQFSDLVEPLNQISDESGRVGELADAYLWVLGSANGLLERLQTGS